MGNFIDSNNKEICPIPQEIQKLNKDQFKSKSASTTIRLPKESAGQYRIKIIQSDQKQQQSGQKSTNFQINEQKQRAKSELKNYNPQIQQQNQFNNFQNNQYANQTLIQNPLSQIKNNQISLLSNLNHNQIQVQNPYVVHEKINQWAQNQDLKQELERINYQKQNQQQQQKTLQKPFIIPQSHQRSLSMPTTVEKTPQKHLPNSNNLRPSSPFTPHSFITYQATTLNTDISENQDTLLLNQAKTPISLAQKIQKKLDNVQLQQIDSKFLKLQAQLQSVVNSQNQNKSIQQQFSNSHSNQKSNYSFNNEKQFPSIDTQDFSLLQKSFDFSLSTSKNGTTKNNISQTNNFPQLQQQWSQQQQQQNQGQQQNTQFIKQMINYQDQFPTNQQNLEIEQNENKMQSLKKFSFDQQQQDSIQIDLQNKQEKTDLEGNKNDLKNFLEEQQFQYQNDLFNDQEEEEKQKLSQIHENFKPICQRVSISNQIQCENKDIKVNQERLRNQKENKENIPLSRVNYQQQDQQKQRNIKNMAHQKKDSRTQNNQSSNDTLISPPNPSETPQFLMRQTSNSEVNLEEIFVEQFIENEINQMAVDNNSEYETKKQDESIKIQQNSRQGSSNQKQKHFNSKFSNQNYFNSNSKNMKFKTESNSSITTQIDLNQVIQKQEQEEIKKKLEFNNFFKNNNLEENTLKGKPPKSNTSSNSNSHRQQQQQQQQSANQNQQNKLQLQQKQLNGLQLNKILAEDIYLTVETMTLKTDEEDDQILFKLDKKTGQLIPYKMKSKNQQNNQQSKNNLQQYFQQNLKSNNSNFNLNLQQIYTSPLRTNTNSSKSLNVSPHQITIQNKINSNSLNSTTQNNTKNNLFNELSDRCIEEVFKKTIKQSKDLSPQIIEKVKKNLENQRPQSTNSEQQNFKNRSLNKYDYFKKRSISSIGAVSGLSNNNSYLFNAQNLNKQININNIQEKFEKEQTNQNQQSEKQYFNQTKSKQKNPKSNSSNKENQHQSIYTQILSSYKTKKK